MTIGILERNEAELTQRDKGVLKGEKKEDRETERQEFFVFD